MDSQDANHIVFGITNVTDQMLREQEHARALRMANQDALTGVKSKLAFSKEERKIDQAIRDGSQEPFALVECGVRIPETAVTTGGNATPTGADRYIRDACMVICRIFKHSPVFRIGGTEFAVVLRGSDLAVRDELMGRLAASNEMSAQSDEARIAGGMALWDSVHDPTLASVFEHANADMCNCLATL